MYCKNCGAQVDPSSRFCPACGTTLSSAPPPPPGVYSQTARIVRPRENRMIARVCAGFAQHYGWDLTMVRIVLAAVTFFSGGAGVLAYLIAWVIIPEAPYSLPVKSA